MHKQIEILQSSNNATKNENTVNGKSHEFQALIMDCKKAITRLTTYIEYNAIRAPLPISLDDIRETFLVLQGYADCLAQHNLVSEND